jgi:hypothetical protein
VDQRDCIDAVDVYFARASADDIGLVVCVPLRDFLVVLVVWEDGCEYTIEFGEAS